MFYESVRLLVGTELPKNLESLKTWKYLALEKF